MTLFVEAVAGSGKTRRLVAYYCDALAKTGDPNRIVAITYTNKAAQEMSHRIGQALGRPMPVLVMTIHQLCLMIIRLFSTVSVLDDSTSQAYKHQAIHHALTQWKQTCDPVFIQALQQYSEHQLIATLVALCPALVPLPETPLYPLITTVRALYTDLKRQQHAYDYDDLILDAQRLLDTQKPDLGLDYILLDEAQDTNAIQWSLIQTIAKTASLFIVGDQSQSIYSFQGADSRVFSHIKASIQAYPGSQCLTARENYRCSKAIIQFVNQLFTDWLPGFIPLIATQDSPPDAVYCQFTDTEFDRIHATVQAVHAARSHAITQIAILLRRNKHTGLYQRALADAGIPCAPTMIQGFYQQLPCRRFIHSLQALSDPHAMLAWVSLLTALNCPPETLYALRHDPATAWPDKLANAGITLALPYYSNYTLTGDWVHAVLDTLGPVFKLDQTAQAHFRQLVTTQSHTDLLAQLQTALESNSPIPVAGNTTGVQIMTMHAAKGLEFDAVILPEVDAAFSIKKPPVIQHNHQIALQFDPDPQAHTALYKAYRQDAISEEKRLFYVACTRAKRYLHLLGQCKPSKTGPKNILDALGDRLVCHQTSITLDGLPYAHQPQRAMHRVTPPEPPVINATPAAYQPNHARAYPTYLSVSDSIAYLACPKQLGHRSLIRLLTPETTEARDFGELSHRLLGIIIKQPGQSLQQSLSDAVLYNHRWDLLAKKRHARLMRMASQFKASPLATALQRASVCLIEHPFSVWIGPVCISGRFDVVAKLDDTWHLIDFKTDKHPTVTSAYQNQLALYYYALNQAGYKSPETALYFCETGEYTPILTTNLNAIIEKLTQLPDYFNTRPTGPFSPQACQSCVLAHYADQCHTLHWSQVSKS